MKRLFILTCTLLVFGLLSCDRTDEPTAPGDFPSWINRKVNELSTKTGESCEYIWVTVYEVQEKRYYNIDFAYSSCNDCNLYDEHGNRVSSGVLADPGETKIIEARPGCSGPK